MKENEQKNHNQGFTLLELLVVVLIIGILAGIALPQYQMAVTKSKVASILPLMRRWKDALMEYKLTHGNYLEGIENNISGEILGVNWPSDWKAVGANNPCGNNAYCTNDYWVCMANEDTSEGYVSCEGKDFVIYMYQPDDPHYENFRNKITCYVNGDEGHKICKALGGKLPEGEESEYILY